MFIDFREFSPAKSPAPAHNRRLSDRPHGRQQRPKPVPCGQRTWLQPGGELPETPQKIDKYFLNIFWPRSGHPIPSLHHPIPSHPIPSHHQPIPAHTDSQRASKTSQNIPVISGILLQQHTCREPIIPAHPQLSVAPSGPFLQVNGTDRQQNSAGQSECRERSRASRVATKREQW
jgi:hypothetical protein